MVLPSTSVQVAADVARDAGAGQQFQAVGAAGEDDGIAAGDRPRIDDRQVLPDDTDSGASVNSAIGETAVLLAPPDPAEIVPLLVMVAPLALVTVMPLPPLPPPPAVLALLLPAASPPATPAAAA